MKIPQKLVCDQGGDLAQIGEGWLALREGLKIADQVFFVQLSEQSCR